MSKGANATHRDLPKPTAAGGRTTDSEQDTPGRILDVAERLVQERGFNGFSYADIATELQVTKPALHYHFPTKVDLGTALIGRYTQRFAYALAGLDVSETEPPAKLHGYSDLYLAVLQEQRMCLCGMLAAEYQTLPDPMREAVLAFFDLNEVWLVDVLESGREDGTLTFGGSPIDTARTVISCLEGAMLYARPHQDTSRFESAAAQLLDSLEAHPGAP